MLLDTSGLLCFFDASDWRHAEAVALFQSARVLLTHDYVLAEFVPLSQSRGLNREQTLSFIRDLLESPLVEVIWTGAEMYRRAIELLGQRLDKTYSLCDAVSFLLMRDRQISEALTTDRHFAQEGFTRLLQP
ncbi:MAG: uncharacterized protein QOF61_199 [Acidobacteriota bacterium]|nr:uncharacterized protein [Acidobacteriota bacterium]